MSKTAATAVVEQRVGLAEVAAEHLTDDSALLHLSDGSSVSHIDRATSTATVFGAQRYDDEALLHPMLSGTWAVMNRWLGRDSFHAGAFVLDGRAWAVVGDRGQGKSTTLAYLALHGVPVLADDLVIEEAGEVFAGPSFVDLRPDAARHLAAGRYLGRIGARERSRLDIAPVSSTTVPLAGWISLGWGDDVALERLPMAERIGLLYEHRVVRREPVDSTSYLRHAALPCYRLTRPQQWTALPAVLAALTENLS